MLPKVKAELVTSIAPAKLKVPAPTDAAEARLLTRARPARIPTARPPKCNFIYYLLEAISILQAAKQDSVSATASMPLGLAFGEQTTFGTRSKTRYSPQWIIPALNQFSLSIR
jgi:hypothetical protein